MPGPITRATFLPFLFADTRRVYVETGKERPPEYAQFANIIEMETNPVKDTQVSGLGPMPEKPEGSQFALDQPVLGGSTSFTARPWGSAIEFTWENWRDELYGLAREFVRELARSAQERQEVQFWSVLINAFDNAFPGFDGVSLCNTAHPRLDGGPNISNRASPDIGFSVTGLQNATVRFEDLVNMRGRPRLISPTQVILGTVNRYAAREILGSSGKVVSADNELNALIEDELSWMIVHHFPVGFTGWFLAAAKGVHDINFMWRDHPIYDAFDDPWTRNAVFTDYQRHTDGVFSTFVGIDGSSG